MEWNGKHTHPLLAPWYATDAVKVAQDTLARGDSSIPWRVMEVPWQAQSNAYLDSSFGLRGFACQSRGERHVTVNVVRINIIYVFYGRGLGQAYSPKEITVTQLPMSLHFLVPLHPCLDVVRKRNHANGLPNPKANTGSHTTIESLDAIFFVDVTKGIEYS